MKANWRSFLLNICLLFLIQIDSFQLFYPKLTHLRWYDRKKVLTRQLVPQEADAESPEENDRIEKALQAYFAEQIQDSFEDGNSEGRKHEEDDEDDEDDDDDPKKSKRKNSRKEPEKKPETVVEVAITGLTPNMPVAFAHNNKVLVGNYIGPRPNSSAVAVRTTTGKEMFIDLPQIIEVWEDISDITVPNDPASWANVISSALSIFQSLSTKKAYSGNFWQELTNYCYNLPVNSLDLCVYIFQERKFLKWISPVYGDDPVDYEIRQFSSAERYVALTLLFSDYIHFKRRLSERSFPDEYLQSRLSESDKQKLKKPSKKLKPSLDQDAAFQTKLKEVEGILDDETKHTLKRATTFLRIGGFKVNLRSIALYEKRKLFLEFYENQLKRKALENSTLPANCSRPNLGFDDSFDSLVINNVVNELEAYSYSSRITKIPKVTRAILRSLGFQQTPQHAQIVMQKLGNGQMNFLKHARNLFSIRKKRSLGNSSSEIRVDDLFNNKIPLEVSQEADRYVAHMKGRRKTLEDPAAFGKIGKLSTFMKMDYRALSMPSGKNEGVLESIRKGRKKLHPSQETLEALKPPIFHHPICIDDTNTVSYDDAFTFLPESSEILIHIIDVREGLQHFPLLNDMGKDNAMTRYFPTGPVPMYPRSILNAMKLSSTHPNEVITVAVKLNFSTGEIESYRIFPAIIGPVVPISHIHADTILANKSLACGDICYSKEIINDLQSIGSIIEKMLARDSWINTNLYGKTWLKSKHPLLKVLPTGIVEEKLKSKEVYHPKSSSNIPPPPPSSFSSPTKASRFSKYEEKLQAEKKLALMASLPPLNSKLPPYPYEITPSELMVNALLSIYSNCSYHYVHQLKHLPAPITAEHRDFLDTRIPRRFGTQPLRNYLSQLQQLQIRYALTFEKKALKIADCASAVQSYNEQKQIYQRSAASQVAYKNWQQFEKDYQEFLENSTKSEKGTKLGRMLKKEAFILGAVGIGKGGLVKVLPYEIQGIATENVEENERVVVKVVKYHKDSMSLWVDVLDRSPP